MSVNATCGVVMMMVMMVMTMTIQISEEVQASLGLWGKWLGWHQRGAGLWPDLVSDPSLHSGQPPGSIALTPLRPSAQLHRVPGPAHISLDTKAWGPSSAQFCPPGEGCAPAVRAQQDGVPSGPVFYTQARLEELRYHARCRDCIQRVAGRPQALGDMLPMPRLRGGSVAPRPLPQPPPGGHPFWWGMLLSFRPCLA